ncbi:MAG: histidine phosphatase family protein, partial [Phycisphaerae bacterium]
RGTCCMTNHSTLTPPSPANPGPHPARLWLVRHGETDWNLQGRIQGHLPTPLNDTGRRQARGLARYFADKPFAAIYASDLPRASETAEIIAQQMQAKRTHGGGLAVQTTPALRERDLGQYQGKTVEEYRVLRAAHAHGDLAQWTDVPGVETDAALWTRAAAELQRIAATHAGHDVLVVTHGGLLSMVVWQTLGIVAGHPRRFPLSNGITVVISYHHEAFHLLSLADMPLLFDHEIVPDTATPLAKRATTETAG